MVHITSTRGASLCGIMLILRRKPHVLGGASGMLVRFLNSGINNQLSKNIILKSG